MYYFFCNAYLHLFYALYLSILKKEVTIITNNLAVYKFCKHINKKAIYYEPLPKFVSFKFYKQLNYLIDIKNQAEELIQTIKFNKDDIVIYPNNYFPIYEAGRISYMLNKIAKLTNLYIINIVRLDYIETTLKHIKSKLLRFRKFYLNLLYRSVFGVKLSFYKMDRRLKNDTRLWLGFSKNNGSYNNDASSLDLNVDYNKVINKVAINYGKDITKNYDHLILYDGDGDSEFTFSSSSLEDIYNYLFSNIKNYAIKRTPKILQGLENRLDINLKNDHRCIPEYIPAELLFSNINKSVISISSASLYNININKNLKAISLLELVSWNNKDIKKVRKDYLQKRNNKIFFPHNFDELLTIIKA